MHFWLNAHVYCSVLCTLNCAVHCIVDGKIILATYADLWSRGPELICIIDVIIHRRVPWLRAHVVQPRK